MREDAIEAHNGILQPGRDFGRFAVLRLVGRGAMGEVYLVRHKVLETEHALKVLYPCCAGGVHASGDPVSSRLKLIAREVAWITRSPWCVGMEDFGETDGLFWMRMEWMRAGSLRARLEGRHTPLPEKETVEILHIVLDGLCDLHGSRVGYCNLKPANLFFAEPAQPRERGFGGSRYVPVKISEPGLARIVGTDWFLEHLRALPACPARSDLGQDAASSAVGSEPGKPPAAALLETYAYMSPEQRNGESPDRRSDVYAMGVLAFQLFTGSPLSGLEPPFRLDPRIDPGWHAWVERATSPDPQARFADAGEMHAALPRPPGWMPPCC